MAAAASEVEYHTFAALKKGHELSSLSAKAKPLGPDDVAVDVTHCGMCHSDLHTINDEWSGGSGGSHTRYPIVPGHEVIGKIVAVGSDVTHLKVGQRVGFGPERNSCKECEWCNVGDENLCSKFEGLYTAEKTGGYASHIRVHSRFAFLVPDELPSDAAAPLLCAGVTVYSPLAYFKLKPGSRVGVLGIGGLGHLAVQFANKMGYQVTVFSSSADKEQESKQLGAHKFVVVSNEEQMKAAVGSQDLILSTTSSSTFDTDKYMKLLRPNGTLCLLGVPSERISFAPFNVIFGRRAICGSIIGGTRDMKEMLEFCAKHQVLPKIEVVKTKFNDAKVVNEAVQRVLSGKARYRVVLEFE